MTSRGPLTTAKAAIIISTAQARFCLQPGMMSGRSSSARRSRPERAARIQPPALWRWATGAMAPARRISCRIRNPGAIRCSPSCPICRAKAPISPSCSASGRGSIIRAAINQYVDPAATGASGMDFLSSVAQHRAARRPGLDHLPGTADAAAGATDRSRLPGCPHPGRRGLQRPASPNAVNTRPRLRRDRHVVPGRLRLYHNGRHRCIRRCGSHRQPQHGPIGTRNQKGGDINIIGPGGNTVGSTSTDSLTPNAEGILTLSGGSIRSFTDGSVSQPEPDLHRTGRRYRPVQCERRPERRQGAEDLGGVPAAGLVCDVDGFCRVNPAGLVTGAGIGALLTIPGRTRPTAMSAWWRRTARSMRGGGYSCRRQPQHRGAARC